MKRGTFLLSLALAIAGAASASDTPGAQPGGDRQAFAKYWSAQGLVSEKSRLDELYLRAAPGASAAGVEVAPVHVEMREDWQRASRSLERQRIRPEEVQHLKDAIAAIVADELEQAFAGGRFRLGARTPVLQARVVDLYLNAPEMQEPVSSKTYTKSFGDMVLVAELRDGAGGPLLLGSWDHRPAREFVTARWTTRVDNEIEIRAAARGWARLLRREMDRLSTQG